MKGVIEMRSINCAIKGLMLGGMVLVLSAHPALAFGENKMVNEEAKIEKNKVDKIKLENVMIEEKKVEEPMVMKTKSTTDSGLLLGEGIVGEDILEGALLGIEE